MESIGELTQKKGKRVNSSVENDTRRKAMQKVLRRAALVMVMQPANLGDLDHLAERRRMHGPGLRAVHVQRQVEKFPGEVCGWWYFRTRLEGAFLRFFWNGGDLWVVQDKNVCCSPKSCPCG
jgi:hypothetical protein